MTATQQQKKLYAGNEFQSPFSVENGLRVRLVLGKDRK